MKRFAFVLFFVVLTLCVSLPAVAQEWTRYRGPNGSGQSEATTIPVQWSDADYNWKAKLPGIGHSSPVLWGDKIFLTSADPKTGTRLVLCLSAKDGSPVWTKEFTSTTHHIHTQNSFASSTPAVDADNVYVAWATPEDYTLLALDHAGKEVWKIDLGTFTSQHGFGTSPIVYNDLVIITNDQEGKSFELAVDRKTGAERWRLPRDTRAVQNVSYATPCIYQPPKGPAELIIDSWSHGISSIEPETGKINWELEVFKLRPVGSPIIVNGLILGNCGEGGGDNTVVAVKPGTKDGVKPSVAFKLDKSVSPYVPSLVANGNLVFLWADRGMVSCVDATTGTFKWKQQRVGGNYSGSPIRVADHLYCISTDGDVIVLSASDEFKLLAKNPLGEASRATPAVAGGVMYLRTESQLFSIGGKKSG